jgi:glycosyltransferase involved in cell wall biosynthesis
VKILYFTRDYSPHDDRFLSALGQSEHQIYLLRLEGNPGAQKNRTLPNRVSEVFWLGGKRPQAWIDYPALLVDLQRVIRQVQPDIIHAGPIQSVASLVAQTGFKPLVSMSWGSDLLVDADSSAWMRWMTRFTLQKTSVLVGDCQAISQKAQTFGFPEERIVLFPWGVDLQHFSPGSGNALRKKLGWNKAFILLCVRSWEPLYGVDLVVRTFVQAVQAEPRLRLILLGGGSQEEEIKGLVEKNGLQEVIHFGGQVGLEDLPDYYRAADLYVSASHSDGSSVSLMEALACGKPALVSDIPGNREWITNEETGWLFKDNDERELIEEMLAASHRKDLENIGKNARFLASQRANWNQNSKKLLEAYELAKKVESKGKQRKK